VAGLAGVVVVVVFVVERGLHQRGPSSSSGLAWDARPAPAPGANGGAHHTDTATTGAI
jgi:hypothetical protein